MFQGMHYVYEVYKERSFSRAAQNLYISQPSLSAAVKKIEQRTGAPLFDRSGNPLRLTECGEEYIRCAEKIMDIQNGFENYLNGLQELKTGHLSIGASNLFASYVLPSCVSRFTGRYPQVTIRLAEADTPLLTGYLADGSLDLVIDNEELKEDLYERYPLFTEQLLLAVPEKYLPGGPALPGLLHIQDVAEGLHRTSSCPRADLRAFEHAPFLLLRPGNDTRSRADMLCRKYQAAPKTLLELDQQATSYHLSCFGMGISFVSDILVRKAPPRPGVVFFALDEELSMRTVYFYRKKGRYVTRAMEVFLDMAADILSAG